MIPFQAFRIRLKLLFFGSTEAKARLACLRLSHFNFEMLRMKSRSCPIELFYYIGCLIGLAVAPASFSLLQVSICLAGAGSPAMAQNINAPVIPPSHPTVDLPTPRDYVAQAYRETDQLLKMAGAASLHEARLKQLRKDFEAQKPAVRLSDAVAEDIAQFWAEVETQFLPAIEGDAHVDAAASFKRLTVIYRRCCKPIPTEGQAADPLSASDDPGNGLTSILEPSSHRPIDAPNESSEAYLLILAGLGVTIALGGLLAIYRWLTTREAKAKGQVATPLNFQEAAAKAHKTLDGKLMALRVSLFALGAPRRESDKLYFGEYLVNGNNEIVDQIKARFGCYATIFRDDTRVATNILLPDGSRALGTPLARGPAYDHVIDQAKIFAGEVVLFGRPILGLYEPILSGHKVIGILFVGV